MQTSQDKTDQLTSYIRGFEVTLLKVLEKITTFLTENRELELTDV